MSSICPLCGKNKSNEALFCEQCSKKIRVDYEVDVPQIPKNDGTPEEKIETQPEPMSIPEAKPKPKNIQIKTLLYSFLAIIVLVGGFFIFKHTTHNSNAPETDWEIAVQENTIAHYLAFIEAHPRSEKTDLARENILKIRQLENEKWNRLRQSDNITELQDFLQTNPESVIVPLVINRIDSLKWVEILRIEMQRNLNDTIDSVFEVQP
ncbi:MAG: hypothetical protein LBI15_07795 [Dysgonamonadaceae bacterium]|jgi:uncharacterized membrane protein YvbJ|nr:hypothetical protein [Dysgonamonadaceae bacterium]